jgi:ribose transport system ATP-binding protein
MSVGYVLEARGMRKSFSGADVLRGVDLSVKPGEVHALMGENGAGKSTLIKIITGVYTKDGGKIFVGGTPVEIKSRRDAAKAGISVIYQELSLVPTLSVAQNIFLGRERTHFGLTRKREMETAARELIESYGFPLEPGDEAGTLGMARRQMVELLKALAADAKIIIMDEPTSALSAAESEKLFAAIDSLRQKGVAILYISHRLEEVYKLADRLTVMRDGLVADILERSQIDAPTVTRLMIGHEVESVRAESADRDDSLKLEVKKLAYKELLRDVSFTAYGGEILGIGGLIGSGRTELIRCIYGASKPGSGEVLLNGAPVSRSIAKNIKAGFGYVPEDRRGEGFVPLLSIMRNAALASYDRLSRFGFAAPKSERLFADGIIAAYDVRPADKNAAAANLSGGNQQKVVLGKWLARAPRVLLLDEPTAGVDVGVKEELYRYLRELAGTGAMIIMVSSDLAELTHISDRILVIYGGRIFWEFPGGARQSDVLLASGGTRAEGGVPIAD